ncbi:MAG: flagellar basal body P-ring formation chaperone FlgA [Sulfurospirillaceae bacterium]|nr:flagellar basal body P-ring formation chaperone FlgA [Sulfurospirillaceae bacterium]MDD2827791.1 flagellar basal body P-ring formation chaperone FlgA [Sulfurospirillaceae bacterium]
MLNATFFGLNTKDNFPIVNIPKDRVHYTIPTSQLIAAFSDKNITVIDVTEGVVIFKRHCKMMGQEDALNNAFLEKFQAMFPFVKIEKKPHIFIRTSLPSDFARYKLIAVQIQDSAIKKSNGTFVAIFQIGNKERKFYVNYELQASVDVFKAKHNLLNGKILDTDDYEQVSIGLDNFSSRTIVGLMPSNLVIKNYIKEGQILMENFFEEKQDVSKRDSIKAYLKEGALMIEVQATLLEDGNIGDIVKIKTEQGKILKAKILSTNQVMIVE